MSLSGVACVLIVSLAQVEVRGVEQPPGRVLSVGMEGVTVGSGADAPGPSLVPVVVGWDRVRSVRGEKAGEAALYSAIADKARRARARLERGDAVMAEPLLDDLYGMYALHAGPTAAMIGEGLLWCRLSRGAQASAVGPWLLWLRCGTAGSALVPMFAPTDDALGSGRAWAEVGVAGDQTSGLVPVLPPVWLDVPATQALARGPALLQPLAETSLAGPHEGRALELADLYVMAARLECGIEGAALGEMPRDQSAGLVWQMVAARSGNSTVREQARTALKGRIKGRVEPWLEAWVRTAVGRSMLREETLEARRLGVAELMHLPAHLADAVPYLTGIALVEGAVELLKQGDREGADRLRTELLDGYLGHPALEYAPVRNWPAVPARAGKTQGGKT